ncbi:uncharacterized protein LOC132562454 [Ylistrum balloti]|uniref:uncharacterized protein LOC132562454 n=1 Tax=Ylistrum balloti TaxID=509963 RepID=UPI002905D5AB|nr:uncharacterized protein LOC132562454 [Ylistrum balloti]
MELYCDHYGNRVHLLSSPMKVKRNEEKPSSHVLFWTGADGRRSKVNLNAKVKQSVYEDNKNRASKELSNEKNKNPLRGKYNRHPFICHLNSLARFSSTIAIPVSFQPNQDGVSKGIVFVDCSCLETFLEIKVSIKNFGELYSGQPVWETTSVSRMLTFQHSDLLPILVSPSEVKYYDKYGEEFDNVYISDVNIECCVPQVYRNLVLYVNQENNLVKSLNGDGLTVEHFDFVDKMVVCRNVIIMFNKERLIFADTISLLPLEVLITDRIHTSLPNGVVYKERIKHLNVIGEKEIKKESGITCNMVAIAMDTHLIVVEIPLCEEPEFVEIKMCVEVPGLAKDICFISPHAGFLVSVTQHDKADYLPRETLYHLDSSGRLQGLLPGLGKGPRSFLPLMLSAEGTESDRKAWHIYLRDGHDGIMCIRLD